MQNSREKYLYDLCIYYIEILLRKIFKMIGKRIHHRTDRDTGKITDGPTFRLARVRAPEKHQFADQKPLKLYQKVLVELF